VRLEATSINWWAHLSWTPCGGSRAAPLPTPGTSGDRHPNYRGNRHHNVCEHVGLDTNQWCEGGSESVGVCCPAFAPSLNWLPCSQNSLPTFLIDCLFTFLACSVLLGLRLHDSNNDAQATQEGPQHTTHRHPHTQRAALCTLHMRDAHPRVQSHACTRVLGCNRPQMSTLTCAPKPQGRGTLPPSFGDQKCCGTAPPRSMAPARRHKSRQPLLLCGAQAEIEGPAKIATIGFRRQSSHPQPPRLASL
jgi:hypothetical protein